MVNLFIGCATFPKSVINQHILTKENINSLNGTYSLIETYRGSFTDSTSFFYSNNTDLGFNHSFFDEINSSMFAKSIKIDSLKSYYFVLRILNSKNMEIVYLENNKSIRQQTIKCKLKVDGYLYIKNKNFKIKGIPYLFGEFGTKRNRVTLNRENNLLLETSECSSGGVAFLMVVPIWKAKYQKVYARQEQNLVQ